MGKRDVCEGVSLLTLLLLCVVPSFASTRGSSDSIAPRDSLQTGSQEMKGSFLPPHGPSMQRISQVVELNHC